MEEMTEVSVSGAKLYEFRTAHGNLRHLLHHCFGLLHRIALGEVFALHALALLHELVELCGLTREVLRSVLNLSCPDLRRLHKVSSNGVSRRPEDALSLLRRNVQ